VPKPRAVSALAVCLTVKPVGEPDAGDRHVRFDERGWETGRCRTAQVTAPILDSTLATCGYETAVGRFRGIADMAELDAGWGRSRMTLNVTLPLLIDALRKVYSITSSARASNVGGTSRPRDFAVCRLITNSNLVDCSTGKSAGLAPLRMSPV
jgi:hypothetical protein